MIKLLGYVKYGIKMSDANYRVGHCYVCDSICIGIVVYMIIGVIRDRRNPDDEFRDWL